MTFYITQISSNRNMKYIKNVVTDALKKDIETHTDKIKILTKERLIMKKEITERQLKEVVAK